MPEHGLLSGVRDYGGPDCDECDCIRPAGHAAGREGPGKAFRLYKEETFQALPAASAPEIQRVSLASLMLQLKQLGIEQPQDFDFMDRWEL